MLKTLQRWITLLYLTILNWLFPRPRALEELENISPQSFSLTATRVLDPLPNGIYSMFRYKDPFVRRALWELKYNGNQHIARLFAALLQDFMLDIISDAELFENFTDPIIIPLPLSAERLHERGWNQAEMIAQALCKSTSDYTLRTDILQKVKHTLPQTHLPRALRLKNLTGCFAVQKEMQQEIKNRNIILLDDVTTTGSTIAEARRTLRAQGARAVLAFTIAH